MALGEIVPWRWGGLRPWEGEDRSFDSFRREMDSLHREMDRLFEGVWSEGFGPYMPSRSLLRGEIMPQLDLTEDDKSFQVKIDLPGLDEKDVHVSLADHMLTIRGDKKEEKETKEKDFYRRERAHGAFRRSIEIPAAVDTAKIEASFKNGVLTIQMPKSKEAQQKVRQITIKAA